MKFLELIALIFCLLFILNEIGGLDGKRLHFKKYPNRKAAEDAARDAGKGNPPKHDTPHNPRNPNNKREQLPHYHPTNKDGTKKDDGSHYQYPKRQG